MDGKKGTGSVELRGGGRVRGSGSGGGGHPIRKCHGRTKKGGICKIKYRLSSFFSFYSDFLEGGGGVAWKRSFFSHSIVSGTRTCHRELRRRLTSAEESSRQEFCGELSNLEI